MSKMIMENEFKYEDNKLYRKHKQTKKWICCNNIKPKEDYIQIGVNGKHFYLHRLVYKFHNPEWDITNTIRDNSIDHINHNRLDNKIENLRVVTHSQNQQNSTHINGKLIRGVYFHKDSRKKPWSSRWTKNGKEKSKSFATELEAVEYRAEMVKIHYTHDPLKSN